MSKNLIYESDFPSPTKFQIAMALISSLILIVTFISVVVIAISNFNKFKILDIFLMTIPIIIATILFVIFSSIYNDKIILTKDYIILYNHGWIFWWIQWTKNIRNEDIIGYNVNYILFTLYYKKNEKLKGGRIVIPNDMVDNTTHKLKNSMKILSIPEFNNEYAKKLNDQVF